MPSDFSQYYWAAFSGGPMAKAEIERYWEAEFLFSSSTWNSSTQDYLANSSPFYSKATTSKQPACHSMWLYGLPMTDYCSSATTAISPERTGWITYVRKNWLSTCWLFTIAGNLSDRTSRPYWALDTRHAMQEGRIYTNSLPTSYREELFLLPGLGFTSIDICRTHHPGTEQISVLYVSPTAHFHLDSFRGIGWMWRYLEVKWKKKVLLNPCKQLQNFGGLFCKGCSTSRWNSCFCCPSLPSSRDNNRFHIEDSTQLFFLA